MSRSAQVALGAERYHRFPASRDQPVQAIFPVGGPDAGVWTIMGSGTLCAGGRRMGRPIIGITGELEAARWGNWIREAVVSPVSYTRAVERAGGTPVILPPVPASSVPVLIAGLNGLLLTGGRDVDPSLYNEAPHEQTDLPDHRRDRFELILTRAAIDADLPFLAVGRGMHILNVARGGTLTQHLPDRLGNQTHKPDPVQMTTQ